MPRADSPSGDHFEAGPKEGRVVESDVPARQAVTGHHVRIVLICSLLGAIIALALIYAFEFLR